MVKIFFISLKSEINNVPNYGYKSRFGILGKSSHYLLRKLSRNLRPNKKI